MSFLKLLRSSLLYYRWTHLAVLVGVMVGTAVIGGALIVGDSVRESLRVMTLDRLGPVDWSLSGPRFFTAGLVHQLQTASPTDEGEFFGAILLPATAEHATPDHARVIARAGRVNVVALSVADWPRILPQTNPPAPGELLINERLAADLQAEPGAELTLAIELPSDIPRDALLGKRDESSIAVSLKLKGIIAAETPGGRFGLQPDQQIPANAYLLLNDLQERLRVDGSQTSRRDRRPIAPRLNTLLLSTPGGASATLSADALNQRLQQAWQLDDLHARLVINAEHRYLSLESSRMILDRPLADAGREVARELGIDASPVLAYIANEIRRTGPDPQPAADEQSPRLSRYSVVAGLEPHWLLPDAKAPFGPFVWTQPAAGVTLQNGDLSSAAGVGEIVLNDWLAADLGVQVGDQVRLTYHLVGSHGELPELEHRFIVRGIVQLEGTVAADRGLIPEVRGITDVNSFDEWEKPFPMEKVTPRDDDYWKKYRATPKAFVTLETAQHLWNSRYGNLTSLRLAPLPEQSLEQSRDAIAKRLLQKLNPEAIGLVFQPVKARGLAAASGTTDFSGLFIGFSFFLILSAMILIGLLFRLGIERRASSVGLLLATGLTRAQVRKQLLLEAGVVVAVGAALGIAAARAYAALIIYGLKTWWIGAIGTRFLELHVTPHSLALGAVITVLVALVSIWLAVRRMWGLPPRRLLAGVTEPTISAAHSQRRRVPRAHLLAGASLILTLAVIGKLVPEKEAFAGFSWPTIIFFVVGMNTLAAGLAYLALWVDSNRIIAVRGRGILAAGRLGVRNASRYRSRSLLSTGLVASATFLIVAIAAGHRNPAVELPDRTSGNGGFTLVAESTVPILYDLNSSHGREKLDLDDSASQHTLAALQQAIGFRVNPGENASCLNIYQTVQPTILGVSPDMVERGGFKFVGAREKNPWELLQHLEPDGAIPVFGDMNTLQYSLKVGLGQTLTIRSENGEPVTVKIAGMFDGSIFQGVLLMGEPAFQRLFPSRVGYQYFLLDVAPASAGPVGDLLESKLPGCDVERVADRLAGFLAVQNTYLSTFQALGGLGLLLGTIGLGTVMLRNVLERRSELALLRATGYRDSLLAALVLFENGFLLIWGLSIGAGSALLAMLPHLMSTGADLPWRDVAIILVIVLGAGMLSSLIAIRATLRTPVLATLRAE
jgi:putative ABC transport system permease protein